MATQLNSPIEFIPVPSPTSPSAGWTYFDSTSNRLECYDGSAWQITLSRADLNANLYPAAVTTLVVNGTALQAMANGVVPVLQVTGTTAATSSKALALYSNDGLSGSMYFVKSRGTSIGSLVAVQSGDGIGGNNFHAVNSSNALVAAGFYRVIASGAPGASFVPSQFQFATSTASAAQAVVATIDSTGVSTSGSMQVTGSTTQSTGAGVDVYYSLSVGNVQAYDHGAAAYKPLNLVGSTVNLAPSGTITATVDSAGISAKSWRDSNYYNAGATIAPDLNNGGFQYCTVSANSTIAPTNAVAGHILWIVVKNTGASAVNVVFGNCVFSSLGAGAAVAFNGVYTGSTWFTTVSTSVNGSYTYP